MAYVIYPTPKVEKAIKRFPNKDHERIILALREMEANPFTDAVVYLKETNSYRKRVGNYRIVFEKLKDNIIRVYKITRRTSKTYR